MSIVYIFRNSLLLPIFSLLQLGLHAQAPLTNSSVRRQLLQNTSLEVTADRLQDLCDQTELSPYGLFSQTQDSGDSPRWDMTTSNALAGNGTRLFNVTGNIPFWERSTPRWSGFNGGGPLIFIDCSDNFRTDDAGLGQCFEENEGWCYPFQYEHESIFSGGRPNSRGSIIRPNQGNTYVGFPTNKPDLAFRPTGISQNLGCDLGLNTGIYQTGFTWQSPNERRRRRAVGVHLASENELRRGQMLRVTRLRTDRPPDACGWNTFQREFEIRIRDIDRDGPLRWFVIRGNNRGVGLSNNCNRWINIDDATLFRPCDRDRADACSQTADQICSLPTIGNLQPGPIDGSGQTGQFVINNHPPNASYYRFEVLPINGASLGFFQINAVNGFGSDPLIVDFRDQNGAELFDDGTYILSNFFVGNDCGETRVLDPTDFFGVTVFNDYLTASPGLFHYANPILEANSNLMDKGQWTFLPEPCCQHDYVIPNGTTMRGIGDLVVTGRVIFEQDVTVEPGSIFEIRAADGVDFGQSGFTCADAEFTCIPDVACKKGSSEGVDTLKPFTGYEPPPELLALVEQTEQELLLPDDDKDELDDDLDTFLEESEQYISLYPNPTTGILKLKAKLDYSQQATIIIMDATGKSILRQETEIGAFEAQINMGELASGLYLVRVQSEGIDYTEKIQLIK